MKKHFSKSYKGAIDHFVSCTVEFVLACLVPSDGSWYLVSFLPLSALPFSQSGPLQDALFHLLCKCRDNMLDWYGGEKIARAVFLPLYFMEICSI